jgi:endonuclease/exonuclease/phosphatase family metal-dependent hydrolase
MTAQNLLSPWLLLGDYNTRRPSWLGQYPFLRAVPFPAEPTYPAKAPVEAIDYCLAPQALPVHAAALAQAGSDHLPVGWPVEEYRLLVAVVLTHGYFNN